MGALIEDSFSEVCVSKRQNNNIQYLIKLQIDGYFSFLLLSIVKNRIVIKSKASFGHGHVSMEVYLWKIT